MRLIITTILLLLFVAGNGFAQETYTYNYDSRTGEYVGPKKAHIDSRASKRLGRAVYLVPARASLTPPPATGENEVAVMDKTGQVNVVSDFRGVKYWLQNGTEMEISKLGILIPVGALLEKPEPLPPTEDEINEALIVSEIERQAREDAIIKLKTDGKISPTWTSKK